MYMYTKHQLTKCSFPMFAIFDQKLNIVSIAVFPHRLNNKKCEGCLLLETFSVPSECAQLV